MVKILKCSYCGKDIGPGTGMTFVRTNGEILHFCSKKCRKLKLQIKKPARKVRWTQYFGQK